MSLDLSLAAGYLPPRAERATTSNHAPGQGFSNAWLFELERAETTTLQSITPVLQVARAAPPAAGVAVALSSVPVQSQGDVVAVAMRATLDAKNVTQPASGATTASLAASTNASATRLAAMAVTLWAGAAPPQFGRVTSELKSPALSTLPPSAVRDPRWGPVNVQLVVRDGRVEVWVRCAVVPDAQQPELLRCVRESMGSLGVTADSIWVNGNLAYRATRA